MKRKIILDIAMAAIMLCLLNLNITGIQLHEILGITIFCLFVLHKILNFKWIKSITINLFQQAVKSKTKIMYAIDVLLLILMIANVATGILISTYVLTGITASDIGLTSQLHHIFAYALLGTLIVHIGLHRSFIRNAMQLPKGSIAEKLLCGMTAVALVVTLLKSDTVKRLFVPQKPNDSYYQDETKPSHADDKDPGKKEEGSTGESIDESTAPTQDLPTTPNIPTLEEYLSKLFCTSCGRRCLLTNPACGKGRSRQSQAIQEYNKTYNTNESYTSSPNNKPRK